MSEARLGDGAMTAITGAVIAPFIVLCMGSTITGLWAYVGAVATPCTDVCRIPQLDTAAAEQLAEAGITLSGYAAVQTLFAVVLIVLLWTMGALVALRGAGRSRWFVACTWFALAFGPVSAFGPWPWVTHLITPIGLIGYFWLIALFPTGTLRPRWVVVPACLATAWTLITWGFPPVADAIAGGIEPWYSIVGPGFVACVAALTVAQIVRFRTAPPDARRAQGQLAVALGILLVAGAFGAALVAQGLQAPGSIASAALGILQPFVTGITLLVFASAIVRDRVYGVRVVVDNVLVGAVLVVSAAVVYAATAAIASQLLASGAASAIAAVATAIVLAVLFPPLRRAIDRLVYGEQDPATIVAELTACVAQAESRSAIVPAMLEVLRERMKLPSVFFDAESGSARAPERGTASVVLGSHVEPVGTLTVALRDGQRRLTRRDRLILEATAAPFAAARSAMRLARAADDARRDTEGARERERAELRKRLHDGVGPSLAVARHIVQGVSADLSASAEEQRALMTADTALADAAAQVRRISRELHPPALEETGFASSLRALADGLGLQSTVTGDDGDLLPDDVRVTLYRIAAEAFVNAGRHGDARVVSVRLSRTKKRIAATISDDGTGIDPLAAAGVGITTMRERAAALGGSLTLVRAIPRGTRVEVSLPASPATSRELVL